ncbi:MAG: molybdate ABC transporter substrate-binding protein [Deltaproteobacteria bacterium]|nr:molybdate ABC transporter substrate-binding protein [Deltaproteobacteria bacterium]
MPPAATRRRPPASPPARGRWARPAWAALLGVVLALGAAPLGRAELLVAAAVSLREPILEIRDGYLARHPGEALRFSFGASSGLGLQIRSGAPVAVFLSADDRIVERLVAQGRVAAGDHFPLARNRIVVIALPERGLSIAAPADLVQPGVRRIALASEAVPVGRYARDWLAQHGLSEAVEQRLVVTEHARATLSSVDLGHADLAIVYATDAAVARRAVVVYEIPEAEQPRIVYEAARIDLGERQSAGERASAERFLAHLRESEARKILEAAGFTAASREPVARAGSAEPLQ